MNVWGAVAAWGGQRGRTVKGMWARVQDSFGGDSAVPSVCSAATPAFSCESGDGLEPTNRGCSSVALADTGSPPVRLAGGEGILVHESPKPVYLLGPA